MRLDTLGHMAITEDQLHVFVTAVNAWGHALYMPAFSAELSAVERDVEEVDAAHAEADRLGVAWRGMLDDLLAGENADAAPIAAAIHAWGAAETESARRSAVAYGNPDRMALGELQLAAESESQAARIAWVTPLLDLLDERSSAAAA